MRFCRQRDATPFMVILAALQVLLHRISGQDAWSSGRPSPIVVFPSSKMSSDHS